MDDIPIRVAGDADGGLAYAIPCPPESLPPVRPEALLAAWQAARAGATSGRWGPPRTLLFHRPGAEPAVIAIADRDARCWAEAVDHGADLGTLTGLALCLRLLALVEVMSRAAEAEGGEAGWLGALFDVTPQGVDLHPALLRAAAEMPLDGAARFDAGALRRLLSRRITVRAPA